MRGFGTGVFYATAIAMVIGLGGCGKSLSDEEKAKALGAISSMMSQGMTTRYLATHGIYPAPKPQTGSSSQKPNPKVETCTAGTQTTDGMTITTECPATGETVVTLVGAGPFDKTCGAVTFKVTDVNSRVSFKFTDSVFDLSVSIAGNVDGAALACSFGANINSSTGSQAVTNQSYDCKYAGADISQDDLSTASCSSYAVKDQPQKDQIGIGGTDPPFGIRSAK